MDGMTAPRPALKRAGNNAVPSNWPQMIGILTPPCIKAGDDQAMTLKLIRSGHDHDGRGGQGQVMDERIGHEKSMLFENSRQEGCTHLNRFVG